MPSPATLLRLCTRAFGSDAIGVAGIGNQDGRPTILKARRWRWQPGRSPYNLLACILFFVSTSVLLAQTEPPAPQAAARSVVCEIHDPSAIDHYVVHDARARAMTDRLVVAVTGRESVAAAWRSLVEPKDIVGIKIAATGRASGATHRAVVEAIIEGLRAAGVPNANILVWDRDREDLHAAGYLDNQGRSTLGVAVQSIEPRAGYDPQEVYNAPVLGKLIWGDLLFKGELVPADYSIRSDGAVNPLDRRIPLPALPTPPSTDPRARSAAALADQNLSNSSHYATILSRRVTKIVNVPVFADNYFAGLGGALFNVTIPDVDNWRRLVGPPRFGGTAIPELFSDPHLGGKVVLNITDGLTAQIAGGPYFQPLYARPYATLYASRDAVALDAVVLRQLEIWRLKAGLPSLEESAVHVKTAAEIGLGNYQAERIDLRSVAP